MLLDIALWGATALAATSTKEFEFFAQSTVYDAKAHSFRIRGNVRIVLPKLTVTCDEATLYASPSNDSVVKLEFGGHVVASGSTQTMQAERMTYFVRERRLEAVGQTRVRMKLPDAVKSVNIP